MTLPNEGGGRGATIQSPGQYQKQTFYPLVNDLRMECEKAGNWSTIKPLLDKLVSSFDGFIEHLDE